MNDFISGIILLPERPIEIGGLIGVAGGYGNVESTVPDASFLESNVVDWTHTDRRVRVRFRIDHRYREAGIVIAFPQWDVPLDTAAPLDIPVVKEASDAHEA